jgi:hypothetical protein
MSLARSSREEVETLAQKIRGQANALSAVGRQPVRVRVVATCLEQQEGWEELAALLHREGIPLHIPLHSARDDAPNTAEQLDRWLEAMHDQLPRALTHLAPSQFLKVIRLLRASDAEDGRPVFDSMAFFIDALFQHDALCPMPINEGLFLANACAANPNPLRDFGMRGRLKNPHLRPLRMAAIVSATAALLLGFANFVQKRALANGEQLLAKCVPENVYRPQCTVLASVADTARERWWPLELEPEGRSGLSTDYSDRVKAMLVRQLNAEEKPQDTVGTAWLRQAMLLSLIHSNKDDYYDFLTSPQMLRTASQITNLDEKVITSYVELTPKPHAEAVVVAQNHTFAASGHPTWHSVIVEAFAALEQNVDSLAELNRLAEDARLVKRLRSQPDDERRALMIYGQLDDAAAYDKEVASAKLEGRAATWTQHDVCAASHVETTDAHVLETAYAPFFRAGIGDELYIRLCRQSDAVMRVLDEIAGDVGQPQVIASLPSLNDALERLWAPADPKAQTKVKLALELQSDKSYRQHEFDLAAWRILTRRARATRLVVSLIEDPKQEAFARPKGTKPLAWTSASEGHGPFVGTAAISPEYTRAHFDSHVRDELARNAAILEKLGIVLPASVRTSFDSYLRRQVEQYAEGYAEQLRVFIEDFDIDVVGSDTAYRVLLSQLALGTSPLSAFATIAADQASPDVSEPSLAPMKEALAPFAGWAAMVTPGKSTELDRYRAIIAQLLLALGPASDAGPAKDDKKSEDRELIAKLSPLAQTALVELLGHDGNYRDLIEQWCEGLHLSDDQARPFMRPLEFLYEQGAREISSAVSSAWREEMRPSLLLLTAKFPFNPRADQEVTPAELLAELQPVKGQLFEGIRKYLAPVSVRHEGSLLTKRPGLAEVDAPSEMYPTINALLQLSEILFEADGKAKPLQVVMQTEPLPHELEQGQALTAAFVGIDDSAIYAFNQQPTKGALRVDWTREQTARVGGQYTDLRTRKISFGPPLSSGLSYWSLWRLLQRAEIDRQRSRVGGTTYVWEVAGPSSKSKPSRVRFRWLEDPWKLFHVPLQQGELQATR